MAPDDQTASRAARRHGLARRWASWKTRPRRDGLQPPYRGGTMTSSQIHFTWQSNGFGQRFRTGVSLHSHTMHSREMLDFVPRILKGIPVLRQALEAEERRYTRRYGR